MFSPCSHGRRPCLSPRQFFAKRFCIKSWCPVWHGCADVFLLNFCVASFWTGFKNLQRQNTNSAHAVLCNKCRQFSGQGLFFNPFSFDLCDTYFESPIGRNGRTFTHINEPLKWANQAWMCQGRGIKIEKTGDFGTADWLKSSIRYLKRMNSLTLYSGFFKLKD